MYGGASRQRHTCLEVTTGSKHKQHSGTDLRKPLYDIEKEAKPATVCVTGAPSWFHVDTTDAFVTRTVFNLRSPCCRRDRLHCWVSASLATSPRLFAQGKSTHSVFTAWFWLQSHRTTPAGQRPPCAHHLPRPGQRGAAALPAHSAWRRHAPGSVQGVPAVAYLHVGLVICSSIRQDAALPPASCVGH